MPIAYCHVQDGVIDIKPTTRPMAWKPTSGLDHMDDAGLKLLGWLPVRYEGGAYDSDTQVCTGPVGANVGDPVLLSAVEVVDVYTVRAKTAQELDDEKDEEVSGILANRALKAYILCINDGSIVPGSNMTGAQLKAAIKAKL